MKEMTRSIIKFQINAKKVKYENGEVITEDLEPIEVVANTMTQEKAMKELRKSHGKMVQIIITSIIKKTVKLALDVDTFMELARVAEETNEEIGGEE